MTILWYGASIFKIDFTAVIRSRSAFMVIWLDLTNSQVTVVELTTPLWIRVTRTTIHNLQIDRISISILTHRIISAICLGAD